MTNFDPNLFKILQDAIERERARQLLLLKALADQELEQKESVSQSTTEKESE